MLSQLKDISELSICLISFLIFALQVCRSEQSARWAKGLVSKSEAWIWSVNLGVSQAEGYSTLKWNEKVSV